MKILHTSDWHLGRTLYGRKRYQEFEIFLAWMVDTIERNQIDTLLIAGDVFDTSAPSNRAQQLYYRFLCRVAASCCRHVVVIAGNHDSPSFLNAPRELLKALDVHVVAAVAQPHDDEVLVLSNAHDEPELIVCAVPYLRDRDIRVAAAGESVEDKERKLIDGIRAHYQRVATVAERRRQALPAEVPIIGMGHLFTAGGQTVEGDGVRELYVGSLAHISVGLLPADFDYLALGHLHVPQRVGGSEVIRYSGSPLPMGFGEASQRKSLCLVECTGTDVAVSLLAVPVFQRLVRLNGDWNGLAAAIEVLVAERAEAWLEVVYDGDELISDLRERLDRAVDGSGLEVLRIRNNRIANRVLAQGDVDETLDDLDVDDVFARCLAAHAVPDEQRPELLYAYREVVAALHEDDVRAE